MLASVNSNNLKKSHPPPSDVTTARKTRHRNQKQTKRWMGIGRKKQDTLGGVRAVVVVELLLLLLAVGGWVVVVPVNEG